MKKILYFEGAGVEGTYKGEIPNCRIRTAFTNNDGKKIYLEILGNEKSKYMNGSERYSDFEVGEAIGFIDSCFHITNDSKIDDENCSRLLNNLNDVISYSYEGILKFVNETCNCSYDEVVILGDMSGYRVFVHGARNTFAAYNYGDEFKHDIELENRRIAKKKELEKYFCEIFNQKYSNASIWCDNGSSNILHVQINVSEKQRLEAGYTKRCFDIGV